MMDMTLLLTSWPMMSPAQIHFEGKGSIMQGCP